MDQEMRGSNAGNIAITKINQGLKFLCRKGAFLDFIEKKMLCTALLQPRFDYACNVWYRTLKSVLKTKLQSAQNKMVRFVLGKHNRFHVGNKELQKLNWLNVEKRVDYFSLLHNYV